MSLCASVRTLEGKEFIVPLSLSLLSLMIDFPGVRSGVVNLLNIRSISRRVYRVNTFWQCSLGALQSSVIFISTIMITGVSF